MLKQIYSKVIYSPLEAVDGVIIPRRSRMRLKRPGIIVPLDPRGCREDPMVERLEIYRGAQEFGLFVLISLTTISLVLQVRN